MSDQADPSRRRRRGRWAVAIAIVAAVVLGAIAWPRPAVAPPIRLPDPNGYDDLSAAGALIRGEWPEKGDLVKAAPDVVWAFVEANKAALDRARAGLGRECMVPIEDTQEGLGKLMDAQSRIRSVSRLMIGEAMVFEARGQFVDASRTCRDLLALGQAMTQGGMSQDAALGWMFQNQAIERIRKLRDRLPAEECRAILRDFEGLDRRRVSLEAIEARWAAWYRGAFGTYQRTMLRWTGQERIARAQDEAMARKGRLRIERAMRFALAEFAIHAHHREKGSWPRSLGELVPDYLAAVPVDPMTAKPIDYPANPSGELTDDLNAIARPDGEVGKTKD